jgi:hypothetical protein
METIKENVINIIENEIAPIISEYNKISHLLSKDEGIKAFSRLNDAVRHIRFLLKLDDIKNIRTEGQYFTKPLFGDKPGALVAVRPCSEEYNNKTYAGFLIGEAAIGVSFKVTNNELIVQFGGGNPCIFIPETGTIVMGYESWWSKINTIDDLRKITDVDIENTWYVKLLKSKLENEQ